MGKKFFATLIVAVVATFAGYNMYQSQSTVSMSDLALANVEALANNETDRVDCMTGDDLCEEFVKYPGGSWGIDILPLHIKKPGWT